MKTMNSLCAALLVCTTGVFAESRMNPPGKDACPCLEQGLGLPTEKKCFFAGYNAPASIAISCGWDVSLFASFLYWEAFQDGMSPASVRPTFNAGGFPTLTGAIAAPHFSYQPGFKVGLGFNTNYDDWTGWLEYTWFHQRVTGSSSPPQTIAQEPGSWEVSHWFGTLDGFGVAGEPIETSWTMNLDLVDAMLKRPYYQGTQLTISPYAGLRTLFLRQRYVIDLLEPTGAAFSINQSHSAAIGPHLGVTGHWFLAKGFRFEGQAAGSLLYTHYSKISARYFSRDSTNLSLPLYGAVYNVNKVRPVAELGLGLGWGTYLSSQRYFFDLSLRYDFMYMWKQNVMRHMLSSFEGNDNDTGDLTLNGLTLTAAFDF